MCVCCQPDVVLRDEELQAEAAEPSKKGGVTSADETIRVSKRYEAQNLEMKHKMNDVEIVKTV